LPFVQTTSLKRFFKILAHDIVPVVYGGADYCQHAPPHSYIDARKFKPKDLAGFKKILDEDDELYNEYFWWKDYYSVEYNIEDMSRHGFCDLCQKLHEQKKMTSELIPILELHSSKLHDFRKILI
jgi:alpha-1,3-fucosyltransferase